jgi:O-antigen/teichoic acid export membrane protein
LHFRKYLRDIVSSGVPTVIAKLRGFALLPLLLHTVGLAGYGVWIQVYTSTSLVGLVCTFGLHSALIRFFPEEPDGRLGQGRLIHTALAVSGLAGIVAAAGFAAGATVLGPLFFRTHQYDQVLVYGALLVPLWAARLLLVSHFRAQDRIRWISIADTTFGIVELGALAAAALLSRRVEVVTLVSVVVLAAYVLTLFVITVREGFRPSLARSRLGVWLRYSVPVIPTMAADEVLNRGDRLLVGVFLGAEAAGLYSSIYALASLPMLLCTPLVSALFPKVVDRWHHHDFRTAGQFVGVSVQGMAVVVLGAVMALTLTGNPLLEVLGATGAEFNPTGILISIGVGAYSLSRILALLFYAQKRSPLVTALWCGASALNVGLNVLLVPRAGIAGAGAATAITYAALLVLIAALSRGEVHYISIRSFRRDLGLLLGRP